MAPIQSPMQRCNAVLRALGARYRLREHRRSPWITVYQLGEGGKTREHSVRGYAAADPQAVESLQDLLIGPPAAASPLCSLMARTTCLSVRPTTPAGLRSVRPWWRSSGARG